MEDSVPTLSHTAVYQWITTLGAQDIAAEVGGAKGVAGVQVVKAGRFRSQRRGLILQACALFLDKAERR